MKIALLKIFFQLPFKNQVIRRQSHWTSKTEKKLIFFSKIKMFPVFPMHPNYNGLLMFSGGRERVHWEQLDQHNTQHNIVARHKITHFMQLSLSVPLKTENHRFFICLGTIQKTQKAWNGFTTYAYWLASGLLFLNSYLLLLSATYLTHLFLDS